MLCWLERRLASLGAPTERSGPRLSLPAFSRAFPSIVMTRGERTGGRGTWRPVTFSGRPAPASTGRLLLERLAPASTGRLLLLARSTLGRLSSPALRFTSAFDGRPASAGGTEIPLPGVAWLAGPSRRIFD